MNSFAKQFSLADIVMKFNAVANEPHQRLQTGPLKPRQKSERASWQRAAVLVGLIEQASEKQESEIHLLLTKRTDLLDKHKGQIAFPGGKKEKNDRNDEETALREANEEIGLDRRNFSKLGELCCYYTSTGYEVKPIVGVIDKGTQFVRNGQEVAEIFTVPLSFLMERKNYVLATKKLGNETRSFYAISYENHYIWGATAGMIRALLERLA